MGEVKTIAELRALLGQITDPYWAQGNATFGGFTHEQFYLPTHAEVLAFLSNNSIKNRSGCGQAFDCADYAIVLKGKASEYGCDILRLDDSMCLGIAWGYFSWLSNGQEYHSCNWVIEAGEQFWWIEPQDPDAGTKFHRLDECAGSLTLMLA